MTRRHRIDRPHNTGRAIVEARQTLDEAILGLQFRRLAGVLLPPVLKPKKKAAKSS